MITKFSFLRKNNTLKRVLFNKIENNYIYFKFIKTFTTQNFDEINVTFVSQDNYEKTVKAKVGDSILKVAHENKINMEGFCACSTCHVIIEEKFYDLLPEALDNEIDMLELAPCITETSRLGCQVKLTKELDGMKVMLPPMTRNFYVDGYVPTPH
ncbi:adrenodoxin-type ferredoxin, putative [Plasmodium malariae]|uniref:Adrenodoxin-type ferredoxin, putative n=1 Tax=Plasmodium malariae TaxID=5858 RepID=A0A1D3TEX3_PLAMA|nr:adrenodoxin-type ferredoxin, putative [Plasmodium malariae]SCP03436.1 adrenodoxin-type ferredoxin, putative [Plasmodium malariae]